MNKVRNIVVLNWHLWQCKQQGKEYIAEMLGLGLSCRIDRISDEEWESLTSEFGQSIERGVA